MVLGISVGEVYNLSVVHKGVNVCRIVANLAAFGAACYIIDFKMCGYSTSVQPLEKLLEASFMQRLLWNII
jgi:hypothetical protein